MMQKVIRFLAAGLGLGYSPIAPGTCGTVLGALLFYYYRYQSLDWWIKFVLGFSLFSILISHLAEKSFKEKDCQKIVIDEVAGVLVTYLFVPYSVYNLVLGFLFFRLFDVAKVFPTDQAQDLEGGLGVVADDLVAGAQAGVILYFLPQILNWTKMAIGYLP